MKKMYVICFVLLGIIGSAAYLFGYRLIYENQTERSTDLVNHSDSIPELTQAANQPKEEIASRGTMYIVESYLLEEDKLTRQTYGLPVELIGFNRSRMEEYLSSYMETMSQEEQDAGLLNFELREFNSDEIVVRKTYRAPTPVYLYYMDVYLGRVIVRNVSDNTIYSFTGLKFQLLPEDIQREILEGKYYDNLNDLYGFLEGYSS
jgi:hypothetical protein